MNVGGLHHAQAMLWRPKAIHFGPLAFTFCLFSLCYWPVLQPALFPFFYALLNSKPEKLNLENNIHYYNFFFHNILQNYHSLQCKVENILLSFTLSTTAYTYIEVSRMWLRLDFTLMFFAGGD